MRTEKGSLDLRWGKVDVVRNDKYADKFAFDITLPEEHGVVVRHLHCDNEMDRIHWLLDIEEGINLGNGRTGEVDAKEEMDQWSDDDEESGEEEEGSRAEEEEEEEEPQPQPQPQPQEVERYHPEPPQAELHQSREDLRKEIDEAMHSLQHADTNSEKSDYKVDIFQTLENLAAGDDFAAVSIMDLAGSIGDEQEVVEVVEEAKGLKRGGAEEEEEEEEEEHMGRQEKRRPPPGRDALLRYSEKSRDESATTSGTSLTFPSLNVSASQIPPQLLQANYDTLLSLIAQERKIRNSLNDKIANLEHTLLETSTAYQLEVDDLRIENRDASRKVKKLEQESAFKEVFEQFEGEIAKLRRSEERAQERNLKLETKNLELLRRSEIGAGVARGVGGEGGLEQPPMHFQNGLVKQLTRRNKELEAEMKKITKENAVLNQQARMLNVSKAQGVQNKSSMLRLGEQLTEVRGEVGRVRGAKGLVESELMMAQQESAKWQMLYSEEATQNQKHKLELSQAVGDVMKYKQSAKSNNLIQRFLDKHAPKVSAGGGKGGGGLHIAIQELAGLVRRKEPRLMAAVAKVANGIEEEVNQGRYREKHPMMSMVEMLEESSENLAAESNRGGIRQRLG